MGRNSSRPEKRGGCGYDMMCRAGVSSLVSVCIVLDLLLNRKHPAGLATESRSSLLKVSLSACQAKTRTYTGISTQLSKQGAWRS
eukprot:3931421-Amphidinium_carterae.1